MRRRRRFLDVEDDVCPEVVKRVGPIDQLLLKYQPCDFPKLLFDAFQKSIIIYKRAGALGP